jgi:hypothetical protein
MDMCLGHWTQAVGAAMVTAMPLIEGLVEHGGCPRVGKVAQSNRGGLTSQIPTSTAAVARAAQELQCPGKIGDHERLHLRWAVGQPRAEAQRKESDDGERDFAEHGGRHNEANTAGMSK